MLLPMRPFDDRARVPGIFCAVFVQRLPPAVFPDLACCALDFRIPDFPDLERATAAAHLGDPGNWCVRRPRGQPQPGHSRACGACASGRDGALPSAGFLAHHGADLRDDADVPGHLPCRRCIGAEPCPSGPRAQLWQDAPVGLGGIRHSRARRRATPRAWRTDRGLCCFHDDGRGAVLHVRGASRVGRKPCRRQASEPAVEPATPAGRRHGGRGAGA